jgi:hypothetical protein
VVERERSKQAVVASAQADYVNAVVTSFDEMRLAMEANMIAGMLRKAGFASVRADGSYTLAETDG